jgi:hypothetical protein
MSISAAERAALEAHLDMLARNVRGLAERLEVLKTSLRARPSPIPPPGQQALSLDHRSRPGAP